MKIYFAGPDLFRPDYPSIVAGIRASCEARGITPLVPEDDGQTDPAAVYAVNIRLIRDCDLVIANLDPFRGPAEPDSGTVYEAGFAKALGKTVIVRLSDRRAYREKLTGTPWAPAKGKNVAKDGTSVEDFGFPLNIMPFFGADAIVSTLEEAMDEALRLLPGKAGKPRLHRPLSPLAPQIPSAPQAPLAPDTPEDIPDAIRRRRRVDERYRALKEDRHAPKDCKAPKAGVRSPEAAVPPDPPTPPPSRRK